jgi:hypothetical protein
VDAVRGDRGQALVLAVLALGLAAATIVGLQAAQERILADAKERRAGEAAVEAAGATLADALVELVESLGNERGTTRIAPRRSELDALVVDPLVVERSRVAAADLSAANGGGPVRELTIRVETGALDISLAVGTHRQRASIGTTCCRR